MGVYGVQGALRLEGRGLADLFLCLLFLHSQVQRYSTYGMQVPILPIQPLIIAPPSAVGLTADCVLPTEAPGDRTT